MKNYNQSIAQDLNRIFDLKGEQTAEVADFIQPVKEINPSMDWIKSGVSAATGTATLATTPSSKDTYITGVFLGVNKNAACDTATGAIAIAATINGVSTNLLRIPVITLNAENSNISQAIYPPIKIDRGTSITIGGTFAAGAMVRTYGVMGFTQETTKGV
jgi:hypothetical protein